MSRIGNKLITVPANVSVRCEGSAVTVEGPNGSLNYELPISISLESGEGSVTMKRADESRRSKALHGTARSLVANMIKGVSDGFSKDLEIQGVGFRASVKGDDLDLNLGKSHPILHPIPKGVTVTVTDNTKIKVQGIDKQVVGQLAAEIRNYYPPEPYKGKGVRYVGEFVRRKEGKSVK